MGTLHLFPTVPGEVPVSLVHHRTGTFTLTGVKDQFTSFFVPACVCGLWDETSRCFQVWCVVPWICEAADQEYYFSQICQKIINIIMSNRNIIINTDQKNGSVPSFIAFLLSSLRRHDEAERRRHWSLTVCSSNLTRSSMLLLQLDFSPFLQAPPLFAGG